jgi:triosephosphate isomerase
MTRKLIVANWKMNPQTLDDAKSIAGRTKRAAAKLSSATVVICPPFAYLKSLIPRTAQPNLAFGSQSVSFQQEGAYTGEVSARMVRDLGAKYAIVGHSEERELGDTNARVAERALRALEAGLIPILCVGEKVRDEQGAYFETLKTQIKGSLEGIPKKYGKNIILAYELVWAIGAKDSLEPEKVREMAIFVRKSFSDIFGQDQALDITVLYGGSVNPLNAADIIQRGEVDGLLVGRASVSSVFTDLLKAVDSLS